MESSERSSARHYDPDGPRGILRRGPDGEGPKRWWPITIIVSVVVMASAWWMTNSPLFQAKSIELTGAQHLSRADVLRLAGVAPGSNVFWLHADDIERRLERSPWVAAADVTKSLPSTLRIAIRERWAVAQLRDDHGFSVVAADGTILASSPVKRALPVLVVQGGASPDLRAVRRSAQVAGGMSNWLRPRVKRVVRTAAGSIVVRLRSGIPVYYGEATSLLAKDRALAAVLRWALSEQQPLEFIDVGAPLAPTARLANYVPPVVVPVTSTPTPTPSPNPDASPSPSPSVSATPTPQASPSPRHGPKPSPSPKASPQASPKPSPSPSA